MSSRGIAATRAFHHAATFAGRSPGRQLPLPNGDFAPLAGDDLAHKLTARMEHERDSIEQLLSAQIASIEQTLAYNHVIAAQLHPTSPAINGGTPSAAHRPIGEQNGPSPDMSTPLLSHVSDTWNGGKSSMLPLLSHRSDSVESWSSAEHLQIGDVLANGTESMLRAGPRKMRGVDTQAKGKSQRVQHLFPQTEDLKQMLMSKIGEGQVSMESLYRKEGFFSRLAQDVCFNNLALGIIMFNTVWIAVDTDYNKADVLSQAPPIFQIVDNFFCAFFSFEMMVRVFAFEHKKDALRDGWLLFDVCLVGSMVLETWILPIWFAATGKQAQDSRTSTVFRIFRLFRLTRVARTARLVGNVPELMILAKGMLLAVRSVAAVLVLLCVVIYIFAIIFTELVGQSPSGQGSFESVLQSANTLLLQVVCGFDTTLVARLLDDNFTCYAVFLLYFLIASLTIMNMLVGILCDVVATVSTSSSEEAFIDQVEEMVSSLMRDLDTDGSKTLCKEEFDGIIMNQAMMSILNDAGVDVVGIVDFASFLFKECDEISFADFLQLVVQFRDSKSATIKDVMDLRKYLARELSSLEARINTTLVHSVRGR